MNRTIMRSMTERARDTPVSADDPERGHSTSARPSDRQRRRDSLRKWDGRIALLLALGAGSLFLPVRPPHTMERVAVPPGSDTVLVAAGASYRAGPLHRLLFGQDYRSLWSERIKVPVLDLRRTAGGLRPLWIGGGMQTRALRLAGTDGRQFIFRSIDKNPTPVLRPILHGTLIADVVQDQTSAELPAAAVIVAPLLEAVGVLHADPSLMVLPDDSLLGEFRQTFAGILGTLEEVPPEPGSGNGKSDRVLDTEGLIARLNAGSADRVAERAFLMARLMDLFLNDWDRHEGQWRWLREVAGRDTVWLPVPRDRDQAFVSYSGLMLSVARRFQPKLVKFGPDYAGFAGLIVNSREIDRRFLSELGKDVWDSAASVLVSRLPDSVIEAAVRQMPQEYYRLAGATLVSRLRERRDRLPDIATRFYRTLAQSVDIHSRGAGGRVEITRFPEGDVRVRLVSFSGDRSIPYLDRRFDFNETREIGIFLRKGDRVTSSGASGSGIHLRFMDVQGRDLPADSIVINAIPQ